MVESTILAGDVAGIGAALISAQREAVKQQKRAEAAERELTAMAARCGDDRYLLRRLVDAVHTVRAKFTPEQLESIPELTRGMLDMALARATVALDQPLPARAAAMGAVVEAVGQWRIARRIAGCIDTTDFDLAEKYDALAKLDGAA